MPRGSGRPGTPQPGRPRRAPGGRRPAGDVQPTLPDLEAVDEAGHSSVDHRQSPALGIDEHVLAHQPVPRCGHAERGQPPGALRALHRIQRDPVGASPQGSRIDDRGESDLRPDVIGLRRGGDPPVDGHRQLPAAGQPVDTSRQQQRKDRPEGDPRKAAHRRTAHAPPPRLPREAWRDGRPISRGSPAPANTPRPCRRSRRTRPPGVRPRRGAAQTPRTAARPGGRTWRRRGPGRPARLRVAERAPVAAPWEPDAQLVGDGRHDVDGVGGRVVHPPAPLAGRFDEQRYLAIRSKVVSAIARRWRSGLNATPWSAVTTTIARSYSPVP